MKRRGFLGAILAAAAAPVFVQSGILMPVKKVSDPWSPERIGERIDQEWENARCWDVPDSDHAIDAIRYAIRGPSHNVADPGHTHAGIWQRVPPGMILAFPRGAALPVGWQECDGLHGRPNMRAYRRGA